MDDANLWRWIWLVATGAFTVGEIAMAGSFFLAPFAVGALVATVLAFAGVGLGIQWAVFVVVSLAAFAAMRPLARRMDINDSGEGVGARRLLGQPATVVEAIEGPHRLGLVQVHREEWRAESADGGPVESGATVKVVEVRGTRLIVVPMPEIDRPAPPPAVDPPTQFPTNKEI